MTQQFAICLNNEGYEASLEVGKVYCIIPDTEASAHGYIRIIDESGKDYAFDDHRFHRVDLPDAAGEIFGINQAGLYKGKYMLDIHKLMSDLSKHRPRFDSEEDFKCALKRQICKAMPNSDPHLEYKIKNMKLDIYLPTERIAIELKYRIRGRQYAGRYKFLKDIERLERVVAEGRTKSGFAVLLTNEPPFWDQTRSRKLNPIDPDFHIYEGRKVTGELMWAAHTSPSTMKDMEEPICLKGSYHMRWRDYGTGKNQQFRYLAVSVK